MLEAQLNKPQLNHLDSLAKWLSVRLRTKWLWVRVQLQSLMTSNILMARNEKELSCFVSDVNFMHLCCLFIQSRKSWTCSLHEKITKISSTDLLCIIALKGLDSYSTIHFHNCIKMHLQGWDPEQNPLSLRQLVYEERNPK